MRMTYENGISSLHIIDSTKERDGEPGRSLEARLTNNPPVFSGLPIHLHQVTFREDFQKVLDAIYRDEATRGRSPLLHFELHGSESGIALRDDTAISWDEFALELTRFNLATRFNLLVVLSCCQGFLQIHSMNYSRVCPFNGLVSCTGIAQTSELLYGFEILYRSLAAKIPIQKAVEVMNRGLKAESDIEFGFESAHLMFLSVVAAIYRDNMKPEYLTEKKKIHRRKMEQDKALSGSLTPISDADVENSFLECIDWEINKFYFNYFAIDKIPENAEKYSFEWLVKDVRRRIASGN
jgi:hypothetical protein